MMRLPEAEMPFCIGLLRCSTPCFVYTDAPHFLVA